MTLASLSLEQAPPVSVPFRFFFTAPFFLILAAIALAAAGPSALESRWTPAMLGITHLLTLGCMSMVMSGAMLQLLPVLAGSPVPNPRRVAWTIQLPMLAGMLLLSAGLYFVKAPLLWLAIPLLVFAFAALIIVAAYSLVRAPTRNPSTRAMLLALFALVIAITLGALLASSVGGLLDLPVMSLTTLHVAWGLVGWTGLLVIGVAYQVVPMFQLTSIYSRHITRWLGGSLFALLALWSCHLLLPERISSILNLVAGMALTICVVTFAGATLYLQYRRRRRVPDVTLQFWRVGMISLIVAALMWLAGQMIVTLSDRAFYALTVGVLFIVGFVLSVIIGMLYKIVPFLIWFHLQGKLSYKLIPNMKDIVPDKVARQHLYVHVVCLLLCMAAILLPTLFIYFAALSLAISGSILFVNLYRAWQHYVTAMAKVEVQG